MGLALLPLATHHVLRPTENLAILPSFEKNQVMPFTIWYTAHGYDIAITCLPVRSFGFAVITCRRRRNVQTTKRIAQWGILALTNLQSVTMFKTYEHRQTSNTLVFEMTFSKNFGLRTTFVYRKRFLLPIPTVYSSVS